MSGKVSKVDLSVSDLIGSVNESSSQARTAWLSFAGVSAYMLVALGSVSHLDLLLNKRLQLPIVNVEIPLVGFFLLAPPLYFILHTWVVVHLVFLRRKVWALESKIADRKYSDPRRLLLTEFVGLQQVAGPQRGPIVQAAMYLMSWVTVTALPVSILLYMQLDFLPYHDLVMTWWHRAWLLIDLGMLFTLGLMMSEPQSRWLDRFKSNLTQNLGRAVLTLLGLFAMFLVSFGVATHPDEIAMRRYFDLKLYDKGLFDWLVSDNANFISGTPTSLFSRNIVLPNIKLDVAERSGSAVPSVSLRGRDFRGAILEYADLGSSDITAANFDGARLTGANLSHVVVGCANTEGVILFPGKKAKQNEIDDFEFATTERSDLTWGCTSFVNASMERVNLAGIDLRAVKSDPDSGMRLDFQDANLDGAALTGASFGEADFSRTSLRDADLSLADLGTSRFIGARLIESGLFGARFTDADMRFASFSSVDFFGSSFDDAKLDGATIGMSRFWSLPKNELPETVRFYGGVRFKELLSRDEIEELIKSFLRKIPDRKTAASLVARITEWNLDPRDLCNTPSNEKSSACMWKDKDGEKYWYDLADRARKNRNSYNREGQFKYILETVCESEDDTVVSAVARESLGQRLSGARSAFNKNYQSNTPILSDYRCFIASFMNSACYSDVIKKEPKIANLMILLSSEPTKRRSEPTKRQRDLCDWAWKASIVKSPFADDAAGL